MRFLKYDITHDIIGKNISAALGNTLKANEEIVSLGRAVVRNTLSVGGVNLATCLVTYGILDRNSTVRVIRQGLRVFPPPDRTARLELLKGFKEDVGEVRENFECGMKIAGYDDIKVDDIIEAYRVEQVQKTL